MQLQFIGSGDAFGSGGRLNTCFHVVGHSANFLIDCGASSLPGLKARRIRLDDIQTIFVTHFHADHFGGVPFFVLDAHLNSRRTQHLTIAGPVGLTEWYQRAMETSFPGSSKTQLKFELTLVELRPREGMLVDDVSVMPFQALHGVPGGPFLAYRLETEHRIIAYTGDTEWTDDLIAAGGHADLLIAEAYFYDKPVKYHLDLATLSRHLPRLSPKRLLLTHMSSDMLARLGTLAYETADDGMVIDL